MNKKIPLSSFAAAFSLTKPTTPSAGNECYPALYTQRDLARDKEYEASNRIATELGFPDSFTLVDNIFYALRDFEGFIFQDIALIWRTAVKQKTITKKNLLLCHLGFDRYFRESTSEAEERKSALNKRFEYPADYRPIPANFESLKKRKKVAGPRRTPKAKEGQGRRARSNV